MTAKRASKSEQRMVAAIQEMQGLILARYPSAAFDVYEGEDPPGTRLQVTADVEDTDEVVDIFISRMVDMQVDEDIPLYVIPVRPFERTLAQMREEKEQKAPVSALLNALED